MTEAEWLACEDPQPMLRAVPAKLAERKLQLFACACCRRVWAHLTDQRSRTGVIVRERFEDGIATKEEMDLAADAASMARGEIRRPFRFAPETREDSPELGPAYAAGAASNTANGNYHPVSWYAARAAACVSGQEWAKALAEETTAQVTILRDIAGPTSFRAVTLDPAWRTTTALQLAQQMYDSRDFSAMPILADALQDAGCDSADILAHCRGPGPHVRGCWVIDHVLGKA
jgi:hypothetical protein